MFDVSAFIKTENTMEVKSSLKIVVNVGLLVPQMAKGDKIRMLVSKAIKSVSVTN